MASIELEGIWWGHENINGNWVYQKRKDIVNYLGVEISFYNGSQKEVKYVTFTVTPYNRVNDRVEDDFRKGAVDARVTGPIAPDSISDVRFKDLWVSPVITRVEVEKISVEFMDGTTETIASQDIVYIKKEKGCSENLSTWAYWRLPVGKVSDYKLAEGTHWYKVNMSSAFYKNHKDAVSEIMAKRREANERRKQESEKLKEESEKLKEEKKKKLRMLAFIGGGALLLYILYIIFFLN